MRLFLPYQHGLCLGTVGPFSAPLFPRLYLSPAEREKHLYVLGITGKGKSKFLEHLIIQDILAGRGCGVIDPHSDLARSVFTQLVALGYFNAPSHRRRILYLDLSDRVHIPALNVLCTPGEPYAIAQLVIEAFRRTWPEALREAPQFSNVMLATLVVLIKTHHTLVDMHAFLVDKLWREALLAEAHNSDASAFFHDRYDRWGREAPGMIESTLNKVSAFTFNPTLKQMLGQPGNALDFRALMDKRKVLLCDLGGEPETRRLLGSLLVTFLEYAAFTRRDTPASQRVPWFLYMDEFQDFSANDGSAKTLSQILSEARKFGLHLTLAHQSLSQLQTRLSGAIGNIQTKVLFGMSRQDAEVFGRSLGQINTRAIKDTPKTEVQHPLYESLPEQWETWISRLQWQRSRRAHVIDHAGKALQILTLPSAVLPLLSEQIERAREMIRDNLVEEHAAPAYSPSVTSLPYAEDVTA
jgi:hypothetical protein